MASNGNISRAEFYTAMGIFVGAFIGAFFWLTDKTIDLSHEHERRFRAIEQQLLVSE